MRLRIHHQNGIFQKHFVLFIGEDDQASASSSEKKGKGAVIDRFTKEAVVIHAPSKVKGGAELQLPSMNALTNKTSSQAFFLRVLKVIIQLRDAALQSMKKSKLAANKSMPTVQEVNEAAEASKKAESTTEGSGESEAMEVESEASSEKPPTEANTEAKATASPPAAKEPALSSLSDQLTLGALWDALSFCLKDLADTPDHHAVLVLQATVEAFFLVHAAPTQPEDAKRKIQQKETRQEQLAHIQEQTPSIGGTPVPAEGAESSGNGNQPSTSADSNEALPVAGSSSGGSGATSGGSNLPEDTQKFLAFAETHRTVLNQILRQSTMHLADGPFSVLVDHTRVLDFDIKRR